MTHRAVLTVASVLLLVTCALARQDADDPVTGNWGGGGVTFLELQYDGKSTVSGTVIVHRPGQFDQRAPIKNGTFDRRTRELRLTGQADRDGKIVDFLVEAKIDNDVMTGTSNLGGERKSFKFKRL